MAVRTVSILGGTWNAVTAWTGGVVPIAGDTVDFTATSGNLTVNIASTCAGINFTNYINTITFTAVLTIQGPINLGTGNYTQAGASGITVNSNAGGTGFTSNGVIWSRTFTFSGGGSGAIYTLNDDWNFTGTLSFTNSNTCTINGFNIYTNGLSSTSNQPTTGTTNIVFNGTGTWVHTSTGAIQNNININTAGTLTIGTNIYYNTGTLTYTSGTVTTTGSTLNISTTTLNTVGITWNNIVYTGGTTTITLSSNLVFIGTFTITGSSTTIITLAGIGIIDSILGTLQLTVSGANITLTTSATHNILNYQFNAGTFAINGSGTWNVYGNLIRNGSGAGRSAIGTVNLIGTGSVLFNGGATGALVGIININTLGTITFGSVTFPNVYYEQSTITYIGGTVDASNCNLLIGFTITNVTTTLNTSSINWKNITLSGTNNILLLTSDLNLTGDLTSGGGATNTINGLFNVNVGGNLTASGIVQGTSIIVLVGTGLWTATNGSNTFRIPIIINTNGIITLANSLYHDSSLTYTKGIVKSNNTTITFGGSTATTLINLHKIVFKNVIIGASTTTTMNEFFSGSPGLKTNISSTTTVNYTIAFQDNFEKISKFINISRCTLSKPQQLLVITNSSKSSTNTRGIRYINQSPNGISKGEPTVGNTMTFGAGGILSDPNMR